MKNIIVTALFLLPFVMMSCHKEAINNNNNIANLVKVTAQGASDGTLKTAIINSSVDWVGTADHVGFYSDRAYTTAPNVIATNVDYFAQTSGHSVVLTSLTPVYWDGTATDHGFAAYYPYVASAPDYQAVPITLPSNQSQPDATTGHIGALDFTIATPMMLTPVPGANPTVNFTFNHVFSILKFDLTCTAARTLNSISVTSSAMPISLNPGTTIDITQSPAAGVPYTLSPATGGLNVTLNTSLALSPSTVASAYMVILPGNATASTFTIVYTSSTGATVQVSNKPGMIFERGKVYTIQQTIPSGFGGF
jgi:hypothetical protein